MTLKTINIVLICIILFTDFSRAENVKRSIDNSEDASGENRLTENEPQSSTAEIDQTDPSSGILNDEENENLTKTNSDNDEAGTNQGHQQGEQNEKEEEKRALPAVALSVLKNPKVQEAVIEKGIEVAGKLVDKQLKIIDEAQEKAEQFLKKEIKLDITPDKSWATDSMYVPPGYHFQSAITDQASASSKEAPDVPYVYPAGIGSVMMNGCYGRNYSSTDPCYNSRAKSTICWNQIDGAAFLGVGFDGRGKYSPESRKMSIVQRNCKNKASYDGFDVPDTMNVHGIYDTSASMYTFQGRKEYSTFLQQEAGVSGSILGFYAGVKEAWGSSSEETKDSFLAILDINIERYEIFMDEVKPSDLSLNFLREFMELPVSYYSPGAPIKYQDFIERWGTHYIKSAKFGGQLEIRKTMDKETAQSKTRFSKVMEAEYKSLFSSVGAKSSVEKGFDDKSKTQTTSTSVVAQGGSHEVASILSDVYSPTFKTEFKQWLASIPSYPKPFQFRMGPITDLVNFRAADLFPDDSVNWGCEGYVAALKSERNEDGEMVKYYEITEANEVKKKVYCPFDSRPGLEQAIRRRRSSLHRAIEVYMQEGIISISDFDLKCPGDEGVINSTPTPTPAPTSKPADAQHDDVNPKDLFSVKDLPKWKSMITTKMPFKVLVDMKEDLKDSEHGGVVIPKNMARHIRFFDNRWFTDDEKKVVHLYNGFNNGGSGDPKNKKISVLGLVLSFEEKTGRLVLSDSDFEESKKIFPDLSASMKGSIIGQVVADHGKAVKRRTKADAPAAPAINPCNVMFSNALRFDPTRGKCLHFTAITEGTIYVMFAVSPAKKESRYTVRIAKDRVDIYKGSTWKVCTTDESAVAIGTKSIHQSYFVCVTEEPNKAVRIEYGKSPGSSDAGDVFLSFGDVEKDGNKLLSVQFYAFGVEDDPVKIMDAHLLMRKLTETSCKGETREDHPTGLCAEKCHIACDPTAGCEGPADTECKACRLAKDTKTGSCLEYCPTNTFLTSNEVCRDTFEIDGSAFPDDDTEINFDTDMPAISEFTISFWVKISSRKDLDAASPGFYLRSGDNSFYMHMYFAESRTPDLVDFRVGSSRVEFTKELPKDVTVNPTWHFVATTWSKLTNVLIAYVDEKARSWSTEDSIQSSFSGGGRLYLKLSGPLAIRLTSFNMWDRVLSDDEIKKQAKSCNSAIGNVKEWYDVWSLVQSQSSLSSYFTKPSTCSAPIPPEAESGSSADDLKYSGKSLFAKYKKGKSLIKDGRKTHH